jgi:hypothetical protein
LETCILSLFAIETTSKKTKEKVRSPSISNVLIHLRIMAMNEAGNSNEKSRPHTAFLAEVETQ